MARMGDNEFDRVRKPAKKVLKTGGGAPRVAVSTAPRTGGGLPATPVRRTLIAGGGLPPVAVKKTLSTGGALSAIAGQAPKVKKKRKVY